MPANERRELSRRRFLAATAVSTLALSRAAHAVSAEVPWLDEIQRPLPVSPEDKVALEPLLVDGKGRKITSLAQWKARRAALRQWWLDFLGSLPAGDQPPEMTVLEEQRVGGVVRRLIRYEPEPGQVTEAYLLEPASGNGPFPGVVVFHSTVPHSIRQPAGVEGKPEKFFGLKLAQRGCVALCPRNFLWPDNHHIEAQEQTRRFHQRCPKVKGMAKMLLDGRRAVDLLCSFPNVDRRRIGTVGHSLGAKEVVYLGAFDERVRVVVSSEGGIGTTFSNWDAPWYLGPSIKEPSFRHEHHELLGLIAPRPFLLLGGDSADGDRSSPFIQAALPVYRLYGPVARIGLFNHHQGHNVPPEAERRIYQWFETYL